MDASCRLSSVRWRTLFSTQVVRSGKPSVAPPPERFNFAQHLIGLNSGRPKKTAYIDDKGRLSYGELALGIQNLASALCQLGVRREERILLLMHDCNDWPIVFLGA